MREIALAPLAREDVAQLMADALRCEPERAVPLAQLVHEKTAGNPFFAIQFISSLAEEGLLTFDHDACALVLGSRPHSRQELHRQSGGPHGRQADPPDCPNAAGCPAAGVPRQHAAAVATLSLVYGTTETEIHSHLLDEAVRADLLRAPEGSYPFVHDRIQEAAYLLVPESLRAEAHLAHRTAARGAHTAGAARGSDLRDRQSAQPRRRPLITSDQEREQLAELNLIAGKRAKLQRPTVPP